jgi:hypothetical protein
MCKKLVVYSSGEVAIQRKNGAVSRVARVHFEKDGRKMLKVWRDGCFQPTGVNVASIWHKQAELEATILAAIATASREWRRTASSCGRFCRT